MIRLPRDRRGYTLIELLVVMSIMAILATLAILVVPSLSDRARVARAAEQMQGWLLIARQRAKRDATPTGVRFIDSGGGLLTQAVYVQQPDDYSVGRFTGYDGTSVASFNGAGFQTNLGAAGTAEQFAIQPGDFLEVMGGPVRQISSISSDNTLVLTTPGTALPATVNSNATNYRIIRQPRPMAGEPPLNLASDVAIDLGLSLAVPSRTLSGSTYREIIFSPSGAVMNGAGTDLICLYVRDVNLQTVAAPTLICARCRTGFISAYPVAPGADPFAFAKDYRSSGL